jgi:hypothetical protein
VKGQSSSRKERLAAALRENLKRRKARGRALKELPEGIAGEAKSRPKSAPNRS